LIDRDHPRLSIAGQCQVLGLARSSLYYRDRGEDAYNQQLMRRIDQQYTRTPFYGVRRMTAWLRTQREQVNPKRVRRLMRLMGLEAIYPKRRLSLPGKELRRYPYLLDGLEIDHPDQVWAADITYIRLQRGFVYLVAILDWYSRYVVSWEISPNLEAEFCVAALGRALAWTRPEMFNTDQGGQFTGEAFTQRLECEGIAISRDGRGRVFDNIFVERLWRSVKYEEVYLKDYQDLAEARRNLGSYFTFYNRERLHQALGYATPEAVYLGKKLVAGSGGKGTFQEGEAAVTPVALRAPSVTAASNARLS